jgi:hypothetical protein
MDKLKVVELQHIQGNLLDMLYQDLSAEKRVELNKQYDDTVQALIKELTEFAPCGDVDAGLYELFHSVKDEKFYRGASYEYVRLWYEKNKS